MGVMGLDRPPIGISHNQGEIFKLQQVEVDNLEKDLGIKSTPIIPKPVGNRGRRCELVNLSTGVK